MSTVSLGLRLLLWFDLLQIFLAAVTIILAILFNMKRHGRR